MNNQYFIERLSGRFKIHRKGTGGSGTEQIATADSEGDATLITGALNGRERLRVAMQTFVDYYTGKEHQLGNGRARRSFDEFKALLNDQKGE